MNRDVCEHFNPVDLPCEKCKPASVQKSTLREAAQQALEALELAQTDVHWELNSPTRKFLRKAEKNLRAALAEPDEDDALIAAYMLGRYDSKWCPIHQHFKWCEHNGGVMGPTGWEKP